MSIESVSRMAMPVVPPISWAVVLRPRACLLLHPVSVMTGTET
jgi:hypothetical protein